DQHRVVHGVGHQLAAGSGTLAGHALALLLRAVARAGLLALADTGGIERAADDLVAHARKVAHAPASHENDRVLLEVVALARDVGSDLVATREAHAGHLAQGRVRLLRRVRVHAGAHAPPLGRA